MSFIDNGNGFYMPVSPAYGSGNGGWGNSFGGDGAWWLLVLILAMNGGWGNGFGAGAGGAMPYILNNSTDNDVQRGDYINNGDFPFRRGTQSMRDMYRGMPVAYGGDMSYDEMSMRRGRGANGRFVSMNDGYSNRSYHSVNDRIIANLEHELNGDISDFERKRIMDEIQRLREMKD